MKYYKIIVDNTFIGAVHSGAFLIENPRTHRLIMSEEIDGQLVEYRGILYRDYWMRPIETERVFTIANIIEITLTEYNSLMEAIENNEEIIIPDDGDDTGDDTIPTGDETEPDVTVEFVRASKLNEMSNTCRRTIESGFDLILRGETHHFSLTTQDQLNLMSLSSMTQTQELIPYHADGEEFTFYTPQEINEILTAASDFKNYQIAYNNALKVYINTLDTIEAIAAITYGTPIPDEYKSDVLRVLE